MESTRYYMVSPSSTKNSDDIHPTNTASAFQIQLPKIIYLRNKYEVALAEIAYPHTWSTFNYIEDYTFMCSDIVDVAKQIFKYQGEGLHVSPKNLDHQGKMRPACESRLPQFLDEAFLLHPSYRSCVQNQEYGYSCLECPYDLQKYNDL